ncbi:uncharacterized protein PV06_01633 [Exophiala oligosperma]|uniref:AB hydrolase-1 domain-containing protein n=1 Tax=Exophiala oligosperma TaxID=215243 RepID=A0A0D2DSE2_9EURO|nr:uncharacterized protein PV06_01633 [Exophiala oligosperma]KIW45928.1 hypothetical protein PV06_01633 [Exophiala oligosperma]
MYRPSFWGLGVLLTWWSWKGAAYSTGGPLPLPAGISEAYVDCVNSTGLMVHTLSAGCDDAEKPLVLLLHGFPEVAYTWIHVMPTLASQGYCVVAPDLRGSGRTTGWDTRAYSQVALSEFSNTNMVRDLVALVYGLGYDQALSVVGHDYGAILGGWASLVRPDMFTSSIQLTNPFDPAPLPTMWKRKPTASSNSSESVAAAPVNVTTLTPSIVHLEADLEHLQPPRKYYQLSNSGPSAANDWNSGGALGPREFLRSYFYVKSADWPGNRPHPLANSTAEQVAEIPHYYVMLLNESMSQTMVSMTAGYNVSASLSWLPDDELDVYLAEYQRVGFQGQLNWYRVLTAPTPDVLIMSGRKIEVPVMFIGGDKDWGAYQHPGALEKYNETCTDFRGTFMIPGAGHWMQLEQPQALTERITRFLKELR